MIDKLKVYYDAEFTGLHKNTTLISIGLVCENGHFFYAEFNDYDKSQVDEWIQKNVINNMIINDHGANKVKHFNQSIDDVFIRADKDNIAKTLNLWLLKQSLDCNKQIQIYCDCYAYDWMLFNDLICNDGHALNLPEHIYYIPMDLSTKLQMEGYDPDITREDFIIQDGINAIKEMTPFNKMGNNCKHNSLWDAYVCKATFEKLHTVVDPFEDDTK